MAADHHRIECSCGVVIAQCRCPGPKRVETRMHPACELLTGDRQQAAPNPTDEAVDLVERKRAMEAG